MMTEIGKLQAVRAVGLPVGLFTDVAPKVLDGWRARAAVEAPSHLRRHAQPLTRPRIANAIASDLQGESTMLCELINEATDGPVYRLCCD